MRTRVGRLFETFVAACSDEVAKELAAYDHHYVWAEGRAGVILTYHWLTDEAPTTPRLLKIVFGGPALQHPPAPPHIQALVTQLQFAPEERNDDGSSPQLAPRQRKKQGGSGEQ
ncbi:MAG: hypothetical protein OHK0015_36580 [Chloroflexi bacterium OHK40]